MIKVIYNNCKYLFYTILLICFTACSTTKNLPEDETLYTGIKKMIVENQDKSEEGEATMVEVEAALAYPPNNALLGSSSVRTPFPYKLWIYNDFVNSKTKLGKWIFNHFAATPVYLSTVNPELRAKIATNVLHNYGYFNGAVSYSVEKEKNPKKAKVNYLVNMRNPYYIDSVMYARFPYAADSLIRETYANRLLKDGDNFSVLKLENERARLSNLFRNNGYYYYRPDYITYLADTIQKPGEVSLKVVPIGGLTKNINKQWYIGNLSVYMRNNQQRGTFTDSLQRGSLSIYYSGKKIPLRPRVLFNNFRFRKGELYSQENQYYTQQNITRMGIFSSLDFQYTPRDTTDVCDTLDVRINATFDKPLDGELEFDFTSKSNDQLGPGVSFGVSKRNAFRGGETFSFKLDASYEWQTGSSVEGSSSMINSYEFGTSVSLDYPRLVIPFMKYKWSRYPSSTQFKLYADQLNRAGYFRLLSFGGNASYSYQPTATSRHTFSPFRLTFNLLQSTTAKFDSITANNKALYSSLKNQFIPAMSYTYTYDDAPIRPKGNHLWWESSVTSAGNVTSLIYRMFGQPFEKKDKELFGNPFAQFLKFTTEIRKSYRLGEKSRLATRFMAGVIHSYGNSSTAPYSEQFYIGGANSIRAFTVRSLGPGSYHPESDKMYSYIDQTGDLKLEANVEYRFPILGNLYGATFLDAGNIWLLHKDEQRPGAQISLSNFGKEIALGTGVGLRYDLEFIILRLDLGIAIHAPYETSKKGYYNIPKFKDGLGLHFAIGYPF